jgi:hypothetical protein
MAAANPNMGKLSAGEQAAMKSAFETLFTADTTYITSNNTVATTDVGTVTSGPGAGGAVIATGTGAFS